MAAALRSILGDDVNVPSDLEPDSSELVFFYRRAREIDSDNLRYRYILEAPYDVHDYTHSDGNWKANLANRKNSIDATKDLFEAEFSIESLVKEYGHCLDTEFIFSDKARYRMKFPALALTHFNKSNETDYKLVDCLPRRVSDVGCHLVIHLNFIARQNSPEDRSKKLFFAELQGKDRADGVSNWVVNYCRIIQHGCKTTSGCLLCRPREVKGNFSMSMKENGKTVIHPTRGFSFGVPPRKIVLGYKNISGSLLCTSSKGKEKRVIHPAFGFSIGVHLRKGSKTTHCCTSRVRKMRKAKKVIQPTCGFSFDLHPCPTSSSPDPKPN